MPRISGVDIPAEKHIWVALTYIYGIGPKISREICQKAHVPENTKTSKLTEEDLSRIAAIIDRDHVVEGNLRRQVAQNITRLREIHCYRGERHRKGLPVRGQRTRSNARTRKGPKKTVAGKKGVKEIR